MDKETPKKQSKLSKFFKRRELVLEIIAGVCLVVKVWIIEVVYDVDVNVLDLFFPLAMLAFYEGTEQYLKKKGKTDDSIWNNTWLWGIAIVLSTVISTYLYVK